MVSAIDKRLRKLEERGSSADMGYLIRMRYDGQPVEEAWHEQHGDRPVPEGRSFAFMPKVCATVEEWLEQCRP